MSGRGRKRSIYDFRTGGTTREICRAHPRSEDASMNQPPVEPSRAADLGGGTLMMDHVIQIVTAATRQVQEPPEE